MLPALARVGLLTPSARKKYEEAGIPSIVCGPGSIQQAHKPDEFIANEELRRCDAMLDALLERLA